MAFSEEMFFWEHEMDMVICSFRRKNAYKCVFPLKSQSI